MFGISRWRTIVTMPFGTVWLASHVPRIFNCIYLCCSGREPLE